MEVLCQTEYQDVYRIKSGVLLIINKFKRIYNTHGKEAFLGYIAKSKHYHKDCQRQLEILTEDFYYGYLGETFKAGQVIYDGYAVERIDNKEEWNYQIKTTGDSFSGKLGDILSLLKEIIEKVDKLNE